MHKLSEAGIDNSHCTAENPKNALGGCSLSMFNLYIVNSGF